MVLPVTLALLAAASAADSAPPSFRILSLSTSMLPEAMPLAGAAEWRLGDRERAKHLAAFVESLSPSPDMVVLQEVFGVTAATPAACRMSSIKPKDCVAPAREVLIDAMRRMYPHVTPPFAKQTSHFYLDSGLVMFSRTPLFNVTYAPLSQRAPGLSSLVARGVLSAALVHRNVTVRVVTASLDAGTEEAAKTARNESLADVARLAAGAAAANRCEIGVGAGGFNTCDTDALLTAFAPVPWKETTAAFTTTTADDGRQDRTFVSPASLPATTKLTDGTVYSYSAANFTMAPGHGVSWHSGMFTDVKLPRDCEAPCETLGCEEEWARRICQGMCGNGPFVPGDLVRVRTEAAGRWVEAQVVRLDRGRPVCRAGGGGDRIYPETRHIDDPTLWGADPAKIPSAVLLALALLLTATLGAALARWCQPKGTVQLLMWRHFLLRRRAWGGALCEIGLPALVAVLLGVGQWSAPREWFGPYDYAPHARLNGTNLLCAANLTGHTRGDGKPCRVRSTPGSTRAPARIGLSWCGEEDSKVCRSCFGLENYSRVAYAHAADAFVCVRGQAVDDPAVLEMLEDAGGLDENLGTLRQRVLDELTTGSRPTVVWSIDAHIALQEIARTGDLASYNVIAGGSGEHNSLVHSGQLFFVRAGEVKCSAAAQMVTRIMSRSIFLTEFVNLNVHRGGAEECFGIYDSEEDAVRDVFKVKFRRQSVGDSFWAVIVFKQVDFDTMQLDYKIRMHWQATPFTSRGLSVLGSDPRVHPSQRYVTSGYASLQNALYQAFAEGPVVDSSALSEPEFAKAGAGGCPAGFRGIRGPSLCTAASLELGSNIPARACVAECESAGPPRCYHPRGADDELCFDRCGGADAVELCVADDAAGFSSDCVTATVDTAPAGRIIRTVAGGPAECAALCCADEQCVVYSVWDHFGPPGCPEDVPCCVTFSSAEMVHCDPCPATGVVPHRQALLPNRCSFGRIPFKDSPRGDLGQQVVETIDECEKLCCDTERCVAYLFWLNVDTAGVGGCEKDKSCCLMKHTLYPLAQRGPEHTLGISTSLVPNSVRPYMLAPACVTEPGVNYNGAHLSCEFLGHNATMGACCAMCRMHPECRSWTFVWNKGECCLKGELRPNPVWGGDCCDSGYDPTPWLTPSAGGLGTAECAVSGNQSRYCNVTDGKDCCAPHPLLRCPPEAVHTCAGPGDGIMCGRTPEMCADRGGLLQAALSSHWVVMADPGNYVDCEKYSDCWPECVQDTEWHRARCCPLEGDCGSARTCDDAVTFREGEQCCARMGMRLCTASEVLNGCAGVQGGDLRLVWTGTPCGAATSPPSDWQPWAATFGRPSAAAKDEATPWKRIANVVSVPMPIPQWSSSPYLQRIGRLLPFVLALGWMYPAYALAFAIAEERALGLRASLELAGTLPSTYWFSWLASQAVSAALVGMTASFGISLSVLPSTSPALLVMLFAFFSAVVYALAALTACAFSSSRAAAVSAALALFASSAPRFTSSSVPVALLVFFPGASMCLGFDLMAAMEARGHGMLLHEAGVGNPSLRGVIAMLGFDAVVLLFLAHAFDKRLPHDGLQALKARMFPRKQPRRSSTRETGGAEMTDVHVPSPAAGPASQSVIVDGVQKEWPGGELALRGVSMTMRSGDVHVVLGHNGAGKTTLISILTGTTQPTKGDATVFGTSVRKSPEAVRRHLGVCGQYDALSGQLTCLEHLLLYGGLRGMSPQRAEEEARQLLSEIGLDEKAGDPAQTLSGGQKRKLSFLSAIIGDPNLVFLDEPTAGMDVGARQSLWGMVRRQTGRVTVLTTHFMDEAEALADTITILRRGIVWETGSPLHLKSTLGSGYLLTVALPSNDRCNISAVTMLAKRHAQAAVASVADAELRLRLPHSASPAFPALFAELDEMAEAGRIWSYGIALLTLEEVFLKSADSVEEAAGLVTPTSPFPTGEIITFTDGTDSPAPLRPEDLGAQADASGRSCVCVSLPRMLHALFLKRMHSSRRDKRQLCLQIALPVVFVTIALCVQLMGPPHFPEVKFNGEMTAVPVVATEGCQNVSYLCPSALPPMRTDRDLSQWLLRTHYSHKGGRDFAVALESDGTAVVFSNSTNPHAFPAAMTALHSVAVRQEYGGDAYIRASNHPLPLDGNSLYAFNLASSFVAAIFVCVPFAAVPCTFSTWVVEERLSGLRHLQRVAGVGSVPYFLSAVVFDLLCYAITVSLCMMSFIVVGRSELVSSDAACVFFGYGFASASLCYVGAQCVRTVRTAQAATLVFNFVGACLLPLVRTGLTAQDVESLSKGGEGQSPLLLLPPFAFGDGMLRLCLRPLLGETPRTDPGENVKFMMTVGPVLFTCAVLFEWLGHLFKLLLECRRRQKGQYSGVQEDDDDEEAVLQLKSTGKIWGEGKGLKRLSLSVRPGEAVFLLGQNGAGKSSAFACASGLHLPTSGSVRVCRGAPYAAARGLLGSPLPLGLCAQAGDECALHPLMSPAEHAALICRLRGLPLSEGVAALRSVGMQRRSSQRCGALSGGARRRTSVALAIIGRPKLLLMDEPTAGVDPSARRQLRAVVADAVRRGAGLLLTTHHSEEVEGLAHLPHRVALLKAGELCLEPASLQHLRSQVGGVSNELAVQAKTPEVRELVSEWADKEFPGCGQERRGPVSLVISLGPDVRPASVFSALESAEIREFLAHYALTQPPLDTILLQATS
eukprot:TRINITY_DN1472_c0_g1_i1.p1 TRINITY_DN1472_c0_g1~~TRINITY_DN1472_c0_g1_i1.p1  ORF type:complete len:2702 (+),score=620.23 TRINITY_DN1472_c0_g1_i1:44-8107(+)